MGSGARAERIAHGQASGEALAMQEHQLAMIPIVKEQTEMQLEMRQLAFEQELEQTKKLNLLSTKLQPQPEPVFVPTAAAAKPMASNYLIYAGLAALAYFLLR